MTALSKAVSIAGGQASLGRLIEASKSQVNSWFKYGKPIPPARCISIEKATGVRCEDLRPDIEWVRKRGRVTAYLVRGG